MGFFLFLLVNAILFVRPTDVVGGLETVPFYNLAILSCLVISFMRVVEQLSRDSLAERPISVCVLGVLAAVVLSHLSHGYIWGARASGEIYLKIILYYLLLVGLVDSTARLRLFLTSLVGFCVVLASLALLQFHGYIDIPSLAAVQETAVDTATGDLYTISRLCSTGIYNDPNDFCLILLISMAVCLYKLGDLRYGLTRLIWLPPFLMFGYALSLTQSRGGFLALLAGCVVLFHARFGLRRTIPLAAAALPVMFLLFGGRQTTISAGEGTGQSRIQLWSAGMVLLRRAPLFGNGEGTYADEAEQVAHNSFVHCFGELGFFGGTVFLGAFYLAIRELYRLGSPEAATPDPELRRLRPYLLAMVVSYAAGMLTLSRHHVVPTYMILGLTTVYLRLATPGSSIPACRFDRLLVRRLSLVSVAFVAATYVFIRVFARWSGA